MENKEKNNTKCELCDEIATSLCFKCMNYYCDSCFNYVHEKKINLEHKKDVINYYFPIQIKCPNHPKVVNSLFCIDEKSKLFLFNL